MSSDMYNRVGNNMSGGAVQAEDFDNSIEAITARLKVRYPFDRASFFQRCSKDISLYLR